MITLNLRLLLIKYVHYLVEKKYLSENHYKYIFFILILIKVIIYAKSYKILNILVEFIFIHLTNWLHYMWHNDMNLPKMLNRNGLIQN